MEQKGFPCPFPDPSPSPTVGNTRHFHPDLGCLSISNSFDCPCAMAHLPVFENVRQVVYELCGGNGGEYEFLQMRTEVPTVCAVQQSGGRNHERFGLREELLKSRPRNR